MSFSWKLLTFKTEPLTMTRTLLISTFKTELSCWVLWLCWEANFKFVFHYNNSKRTMEICEISIYAFMLHTFVHSPRSTSYSKTQRKQGCINKFSIQRESQNIESICLLLLSSHFQIERVGLFFSLKYKRDNIESLKGNVSIRTLKQTNW